MLPPLILLLLQLMFLPPAPDSVAVLSPALEHTVPAQCSFSNVPKLTPTGHGGRVGEGGQAGSRGCHYIGLRNTEKTAAARYSRHFYPFCSVSPCSVLPYFFLPCSILPCWVLPCSVHTCSVFQCCVLPCCVLPCSVLLCSVLFFSVLFILVLFFPVLLFSVLVYLRTSQVAPWLRTALARCRQPASSHC